MPKATVQQCHALTSHYVSLFKKKYKTDPIVNRHSARWGFDSVLSGMSPEEARDLLDYYFLTNNTSRHRLDWFFYNYDKLIENKMLEQEEAQKRQRLRKESEERSRLWRERGNQTISTSEVENGEH